MGSFSKESLETLRSQVDLKEVMDPYVSFQRSGGYYKARCPFHEEKTPSFVIAKGDMHYHCYGCGAHGDAIQFLISFLRMSFVDAVKFLADKFGVSLQEEETEQKGPTKATLRKPLEEALSFYHYCLLYTEEGEKALDYLYERGIDLSLIETFSIGYAPKAHLLQGFLQKKGYSIDLLLKVGLVKQLHSEKIADFFTERMIIPIYDGIHHLIGFTARKIQETSFGPKYVNSPETPLFKKSKILFGLNYSRKTIAKQRKALLVEGQIDALRLIEAGFTFTVASQGTAFTEDHAKELLQLGIEKVYLAFDADSAGKQAASKVGDFFQKEGVEVAVVRLPPNLDPDLILREKGPKEMEKLIESAQDFLTFLVDEEKTKLSLQSPAQKTELVQKLAKKIRGWDHPLMVHESLRKLARLTQTPENLLSLETGQGEYFVKKEASIAFTSIDPDKILEGDFLRWLFLLGEEKPHLVKMAIQNLSPSHFKTAVGFKLYEKYIELFQAKRPLDILSITSSLRDTEAQLFLSELLQKKVNPSRVEETFIHTMQKMLDRHWMQMREEIKAKIFEGKCSEEEVMELARCFDELKKHRPKVEILSP